MSLSNYFESLASLRVIATDDGNAEIPLDDCIDGLAERCQLIRDVQRVFFIGNGGSAAIASHMAADWMKNGHFASLAFNDAAALTCITNDVRFEDVFALPLARHVSEDDIVFAISSSGESLNILHAAQVATDASAYLVTLSGFAPSNQLRRKGKINFYVPSQRYGFVEIRHLTILHAILDHCMGWKSL